MINFLKNVIPTVIFIIGKVFDVAAKILNGISIIFYNLSITVHMLFNTDTGKKISAIEKSTAEILALYNNIAKKAAEAQEFKSSEENKLANIIKENKNVVQLGNKKDDEPKS